MNIQKPVVAWLEDDDTYREEVRKQTRRDLPGVAIHFSKGVAGFWECLGEFSIRLLVVDVMLPKLADVPRLSEGVWVAKWIRERKIPRVVGCSLKIPEETWALGDRYTTNLKQR